MRCLPPAAFWLAVTSATLSGQAPGEGRLQPLPLTQLDERAPGADLDNRTFSLTFAQPVPVRDLLLQLVRGTSLSIIPDPAIEGAFVGELKNVTVRQALGLILPPGLDYHVEGAFIRVGKREPETRLFDVNYLASSRSGSTTIGGSSAGGSTATISVSTTADVFAEIAGGVKMLLSPAGVFNVDRKAGLVQVTDFPERLDRIALYLDTVHSRVHRQVQIDLRIIEVELNDPDAEMLDWAAVATGAGAEGAAPARGNVVGLRVTDANQLLARLAAQGRVATIAAPRIVALNNEPALVRAAAEAPAARPGQRPAVGAVTLEVTPQIAANNVITLSLSPIVTLQEADSGSGAAALTTIRETDTLARVADGETLVLGGFTRQRETRQRQNAGTRGGWFGRSTVVTRKRVELVILLTPRILQPVGAP